MVDLSIIIISYNTKAITKKCLDTICSSLHLSMFSTEIIVVDNASKDGSVAMLETYKKHLSDKNLSFTLINSYENLGYAKANNLAVKQAKGTYIVIMNSDIEVLDNAIAELFSFYKSQHAYSFIGAKLLNNDMTDQPSAAPFYTLPVIFGALFMRGDYWGLTRYSPSQIKKVDWVSGACFITTKKIYETINGFDENIFMYMDEVDFFFRARQTGLLVGFYPLSRFIHLGSASSQGKSQPILQVFRGFLYFYHKHYRGSKLTILKSMLQLKALISLGIGYTEKILLRQKDKNYLIRTYEEAYRISTGN